MAVKRIVATFACAEFAAATDFYGEVFGMAIVMDHGWIVTLGAPGDAAPQLSFAREGGSGAPVPDLSIEVDDLDAVHARVVARGGAIEYPLTAEPWGVRRFFVRDPFGRLLNILAHD